MRFIETYIPNEYYDYSDSHYKMAVKKSPKLIDIDNIKEISYVRTYKNNVTSEEEKFAKVVLKTKTHDVFLIVLILLLFLGIGLFLFPYAFTSNEEFVRYEDIKELVNEPLEVKLFKEAEEEKIDPDTKVVNEDLRLNSVKKKG